MKAFIIAGINYTNSETNPISRNWMLGTAPSSWCRGETEVQEEGNLQEEMTGSL